MFRSLSRFTLFWFVSVLASYAAALFLPLLWIAKDPGSGAIVMMDEMVGQAWIGAVLQAVPMAVVFWLPGYGLFRLMRRIFRPLGRAVATAGAAGLLALIFAGAYKAVFGGAMHDPGYVGLVIAPLVAQLIYRKA